MKRMNDMNGINSTNYQKKGTPFVNTLARQQQSVSQTGGGSKSTSIVAGGTDGKALVKKVNDPKLDLVKGLDLYNDLDRKIAQLNQSIYFLREQKNQLNERLITIVKSKKMQDKNLVLNGTKYKYCNSNPPVNVTKNYVREKLIKFFKGNEKKADLLVNYIYDNRERTTKEEINITRF